MVNTPGSSTPGPGSRRRPEFSEDEDRTPLTGASSAPLTSMQEPLGSMDRPAPRRSDDNDLNLASDGTTRRAGNLGRTDTPGTAAPARNSRSFTTTFVIAAIVLVAAFLIAMWIGNNRSDVATGPASTQAPVADTTTPGTTSDTTGSTTAPAPQTAPGTGDAGGTGSTTGTGSGAGTAPATP